MKARIIPTPTSLSFENWKKCYRKFIRLARDHKLSGEQRVNVLEVHQHEDQESKEKGFLFRCSFKPDIADLEAKFLIFSVALPLLGMGEENCQNIFNTEMNNQLPKLEEEYERVVVNAGVPAEIPEEIAGGVAEGGEING